MGVDIKKLILKEKAKLVSGKDFWHTFGFESAGVRELRFSDGPSGLRVQAKKADSLGLNNSMPSTCFPTHASLACSFDAHLLYEVGKRMGEEAAHFGVDVLLAPGLNIKRSPLCGRNFEYFSEDPYLSGVYGAAFVSGVQSTGKGACVKHFAANNRELGRMIYDSAVDIRTLREIYLTAFEMVVKNSKPIAVMSAYNKINGVYCNQNKWLLSDVLRGEWGFDGIVVSDWGGTYDRIEAIKAGADLEMPGCKFSVNEICDAVQSGALSEEELDACAERIASLSDRISSEIKKCDMEEHADFTVTCAENCAVLLKNEGALPLKKGAKIAVVGEFAKRPLIQGIGSSHVNPTREENLLGCLSENAEVLGYARGYKANGKKNKALIKKAVRLCKKADIIVCCLGMPDGDHEGVDRKNIDLPENQRELLKALYGLKKDIVGVLSCGSAADTEWDSGLSALLYAGLNGQGGPRAVANILTGKVNPSGKLAESFPIKLEDTPCNGFYDESTYYTYYYEGSKVGYRHYIAGAIPVKYPFGHGLSYTEFTYTDLEIDDKKVSFTLTNTGDCGGAEAVQLYIGYPDTANSPARQFKGCKKVYLGAGESAKIEIPFDEYSFRSLDENCGKWVIVGGQYKIFVGSSSEDLRLFGEISKEGVEGVAAPVTDNLKAADYPYDDGRKRLTVDLYTPFAEMKKSRGWLVRTAVKVTLRVTRNNPTVGGTIRCAHVRTGAQFAAFTKRQTEGLLDAFNGRYLRGIYKMIRGRKDD